MYRLQASKIGIDLPSINAFNEFNKKQMDALPSLGMDALPVNSLVTSSSNTVPAQFVNYFDTRVVEIFTAPRRAKLLAPMVKKGSFGTVTETFTVLELTGSIEPYSDYSNGGSTGYNANFPQRDAFYFENMVEVGDREVATQAMARVDAYGRKQEMSARIIDIAHNYMWLYGVQGMRNYGFLNDPSLNPVISPANIDGKTHWIDKTVEQRADDVVALATELVVQSGGNIQRSDRMVLACSPSTEILLTKPNIYGLTVIFQIHQSFPNLEIVAVPEYSTEAGELVQLIAPEVLGQQTAELGFVELMRGHGVERKTSSIVQKNSAANFGAIIYQPFAIAQMLGV